MIDKGRCDICGQRLTDASGSWAVRFHYTGCMSSPDRKYKMCTACESIVIGYLDELADVRSAKREAEGWGNE